MKIKAVEWAHKIRKDLRKRYQGLSVDERLRRMRRDLEHDSRLKEFLKRQKSRV